MSLAVHVVSHTHWDREWYQPLGRFRQRLVALVDELLDDPPAPGTSFVLDGQGIVLEDYLAVRPERRAELAALLRDARLEAGPWYVLADELIPGGEALVRNLLQGRGTLRALRAESPPVLYCPDSFGHPAMLPAVAEGFGFGAVILWRGYGGPRWPAGDAAWWQAPSGAGVLLLHLPPDGYEYGSNLPVDDEAAAERWQAMRAVLASRARLGVVLVQNGADHHARQLGHDHAIAALARAAAGDDVAASSLGAFVRDARSRAAQAELPAVTGELRDSYGYTWTLQGTFGTRAAQKRINALVERALVRDAEPWAAIARAREGTSRRALLGAAWRALLECHPHDTLCGCSIDAVARAADVRWEDAASQAAGIREDAVFDVAGHDPVCARTERAAWRPMTLLRNRAARARGGVARLAIDTFLADVGVGPGSAGQRIVIPEVLHALRLPVPFQILSEEVVHARTESPRHYPDDDLVVRRQVLALVDEMPGYGIRGIALGPDAAAGSDLVVADGNDKGASAVGIAEGAVHADGAAKSRHAGSVRMDSSGGGHVIDNGLLMVRITADGRVTVSSSGRGDSVESVLAFECHGDAGDLYTPSIREPAPAPSVASVRALHTGPLRAAVAIDCVIPGAGGAGASTATAVLSLDAREPFLRIRIDGDHRGHDQRLRVRLATGVPGARVWADAAFGTVERVPLEVSPADAAREVPPPTAPLHRYVSLFGDDRGATVHSDGLAEYEVMDDGSVAITLVRAVGGLSRHDLPERPGHAGWPSPTPGAQCRGPFAAELALQWHGGTRDLATIDAIERVSDDVLLPLTGDTLRSALDLLPPGAGVTLEGEGLAFSALKESEDGQWIVARCVNLTETPRSGQWHFGWPVTEANLSRLDETPLAALAIDASGRTVAFDVAPRGVHTILVRGAR